MKLAKLMFLSLEQCYLALNRMLEGLGPTARRQFTQILGTVALSNMPVSVALLNFLCDVPDLITGLGQTAADYLQRLLLRYEGKYVTFQAGSKLIQCSISTGGDVGE